MVSTPQNTKITNTVAVELGRVQHCNIMAWQWLMSNPTHAGYFIWDVSQNLYHQQKISKQQFKDAIDIVWSVHASKGSPSFLKHIVQQTVAENLGIITHVAKNHSQQYSELFAKMDADFSLRSGLETMLHTIDENTDHLIAQTQISTPVLNQWRSQWEQLKNQKQAEFLYEKVFNNQKSQPRGKI